MGNCLKTQLKESVSNDNLVEVGHMRIHVTPQTIVDGENQQKLELAIYDVLDGAVIVKIVGDGYFAESFAGLSDPAQRKTTISLESSQISKALYFSVGTYDIDISNKYNLFNISYSHNGDNSSVFTLDSSGLKFSHNMYIVRLYGDSNRVNLEDFNGSILQSFYLTRGSLYGDLNNVNILQQLGTLRLEELPNSIDIAPLANCINCNYLNISNNPNFHGDITTFGNCIKMGILAIYGSNAITGTLESLAAAQVAAGKTADILYVDMNSVVTIGGETVPNGTRKTITFNSSLPNGYSIA